MLGFEIVFCTVGKEEENNGEKIRPAAPPAYVNPPAYDQSCSKTKNVTASPKSTEEDEEDSCSLKIAFEGLDLSDDESLV